MKPPRWRLGRTSSSAALVTLALGTAACPGSGAPPPPSPLPSIALPPPSALPAASASAAVTQPCVDPAAQAFASHPSLGTFCAARAACPGFSGWIDGRTYDKKPRREQHEWSAGISSGWALLTVGPWDDARVFEQGPQGFTLRYLVDWGTARLLGDRLWVDQGGLVTLVELATGAMTRLGRRRLVALGDADLYVADTERVVRLRRSDLSELGSVLWAPADDMRVPAHVHVMRAGATVLVDAGPGGVLADFDSGKILRQHLGRATVRPDGARLVACDLDAGALVEVETATGATTATFRGRGLRCSKDAFGTTLPAYAADPRYVFWGEAGPPSSPYAPGSIVVAVGDTAQGSVSRYVDRAEHWVGPSGDARFDAAHGRLCLGFGLPSVHWELCAWEMATGGRPVRSLGSIAAPVGLPPGGDRLVEATSPSGDRTAVLFERNLSGTARELAVASATRGKPDRTTVVATGELPWSPLRDESPYPGATAWERVGVRPIGLVYFDERHLAVLPSSGSAPHAAYLDVETGSVQPLCAEARRGNDCLLAGDGVEPDQALGIAPAHPRWVSMWDSEALFDGTTGKSYKLAPSDAEWEKATRIVPACP